MKVRVNVGQVALEVKVVTLPTAHWSDPLAQVSHEIFSFHEPQIHSKEKLVEMLELVLNKVKELDVV